MRRARRPRMARCHPTSIPSCSYYPLPSSQDGTRPTLRGRVRPNQPADDNGAAVSRPIGTPGRSRSCGRPRHSNIQSLNECSTEKVASTLGFVFSSGELTLKGGWVGRGAPREIGAKAGKARPETKEGCGGQRAAPRQALAVSAQSEAETTLWPFVRSSQELCQAGTASFRCPPPQEPAFFVK